MSRDRRMTCAWCQKRVAMMDAKVQAGGETWHMQCFADMRATCGRPVDQIEKDVRGLLPFVDPKERKWP